MIICKLLQKIMFTLPILAGVCFADIYKVDQISEKQSLAIVKPKYVNPNQYKVGQAVPATGGVVPLYYNENDGEYYCLLGEDGQKGFADFGGGLDVIEKNGKNDLETLLECALREFYEECCGVYDYRKKMDEVIEKAGIYLDDNQHFPALIAFLPVEYKKASEFFSAKNKIFQEYKKNKNPHLGCMLEKTDFRWVNVKDLYNNVRGSSPKQTSTLRILNDDGSVSTKTVLLRKWFFEYLKKTEDLLAAYLPKTIKNVQQNIQPIQDVYSFDTLLNENLLNPKEEALIFLDIDDTLLVAEGPYLNKNIDKNNLGGDFFNQHHFMAIESDIGKKVEQLKNKYPLAKIIGLTKRNYSAQTKKQLEMLGISFDASFLEGLNDPLFNVVYSNGIIFTNNHSKGESLAELLEKIKNKFKPKQILMLDDQINNLNDIAKFIPKGIQYVPCLFKGAEKFHKENVIVNPFLAIKEYIIAGQKGAMEKLNLLIEGAAKNNPQAIAAVFDIKNALEQMGQTKGQRYTVILNAIKKYKLSLLQNQVIEQNQIKPYQMPVVAFSDLVEIGKKPGGAVPGALFKDKKTNQEYIVKYVDKKICKNEFMAYQFYKAANIAVPEFIVVEKKDTDQLFLGVKKIEGLKPIQLKDGAKNKDILDAFIIDAWLGNYDVFGINDKNINNIDNILEVNGKPIHIDIGAALEHKAQGAPKGLGFNANVNEAWFLLNIGGDNVLKNLFPYGYGNIHKALMEVAGKVFSGLTYENIEAGYKKLAAMTDKKIEEIVSAILSEKGEVAQKNHLIKLLKDRRDQLISMKTKILSAIYGN